MMNIGDKPLKSTKGLSVSVGWKRKNEIKYVLEGNINYAGGVIRWLQEKMQLISSPEELEENINKADENDETVFVPAFTGLSAPYWESEAKAAIFGMGRNTGKEEIIKAAIESIAFQVDDVVEAMKEDSLLHIKELRADGGLTKSSYLMRFQADLGKVKVSVANREELSVIGVAYMAGISLGIYNENQLFKKLEYEEYEPDSAFEKIKKKKENWGKAVSVIVEKERRR
jgi:glycerol kinase